MVPENQTDIRDEIRKVGGKVDILASNHESDRKFLQSLHSDHLRLEGRVKLSEERIQKAQSDLDRHVEVACVLQESTRKEISETKDMLRGHIAQEDLDRKEVIKHLRESNIRVKQDGKHTLMWAGGISITVISGLFGLLWVTGNVGV